MDNTLGASIICGVIVSVGYYIYRIRQPKRKNKPKRKREIKPVSNDTLAGIYALTSFIALMFIGIMASLYYAKKSTAGTLALAVIVVIFILVIPIAMSKWNEK